MIESIFLGAAAVWILFSLILIIWLWRDRLDSKKEIKQLEEQIRSLLTKRKDLTYEVIGHQEVRVEKRLVGKRESLKIGYKIQYFVDGIPFVVSEPKITDSVKKKEVDLRDIEKMLQLAIKTGRQAFFPVDISIRENAE